MSDKRKHASRKCCDLSNFHVRKRKKVQNIFDSYNIRQPKKNVVQYLYADPMFMEQATCPNNTSRIYAGAAEVVANVEDENFFDCASESDPNVNANANENDFLQQQVFQIADVLNKIKDPKQFKDLLKEVAYTSYMLYRTFRKAYSKTKKNNANEHKCEYCREKLKREKNNKNELEPDLTPISIKDPKPFKQDSNSFRDPAKQDSKLCPICSQPLAESTATDRPEDSKLMKASTDRVPIKESDPFTNINLNEKASQTEKPNLSKNDIIKKSSATLYSDDMSKEPSGSKSCACDKKSSQHQQKIIHMKPLSISIPIKLQVEAENMMPRFIETEIILKSSIEPQSLQQLTGRPPQILAESIPNIATSTSVSPTTAMPSNVGSTPQSQQAINLQGIPLQAASDIFYSCISSSGIIEPIKEEAPKGESFLSGVFDLFNKSSHKPTEVQPLEPKQAPAEVQQLTAAMPKLEVLSQSMQSPIDMASPLARSTLETIPQSMQSPIDMPPPKARSSPIDMPQPTAPQSMQRPKLSEAPESMQRSINMPPPKPPRLLQSVPQSIQSPKVISPPRAPQAPPILETFPQTIQGPIAPLPNLKTILPEKLPEMPSDEFKLDFNAKAKLLRDELLKEVKETLDRSQPEIALKALQERELRHSFPTVSRTVQKPTPVLKTEKSYESPSVLMVKRKNLQNISQPLELPTSWSQYVYRVKEPTGMVSENIQTDVTAVNATGHYKRNELRVEIKEDLKELLEPKPIKSANKYENDERDEILLDLSKLFHPKTAPTKPKQTNKNNTLEDIRYLLAPAKSSLPSIVSRTSIVINVRYILSPKLKEKEKPGKKIYTKEVREKILDNLHEALRPKRQKKLISQKSRDSFLYDLRYMLDTGEAKVPNAKKIPQDEKVLIVNLSRDPQPSKPQPKPPTQLDTSALSDLKYLLDTSQLPSTSQLDVPSVSPSEQYRIAEQEPSTSGKPPTASDGSDPHKEDKVDQAKLIPSSQVVDQTTKRRDATKVEGVSLASTLSQSTSSDTFFAQMHNASSENFKPHSTLKDDDHTKKSSDIETKRKWLQQLRGKTEIDMDKIKPERQISIEYITRQKTHDMDSYSPLISDTAVKKPDLKPKPVMRTRKSIEHPPGSKFRQPKDLSKIVEGSEVLSETTPSIYSRNLTQPVVTYGKEQSEDGPSTSRYDKSADDSIVHPPEVYTDRRRYSELLTESKKRPSISRYATLIDGAPEMPKEKLDRTRYSEFLIKGKTKPLTEIPAKPTDDSIDKQQEQLDRTRHFALIPKANKPREIIHDRTKYSDSEIRRSKSTKSLDKSTVKQQQKLDRTRYSELLIDAESRPSRFAEPTDDSIVKPQEQLDRSKHSALIPKADSCLSATKYEKPSADKSQESIHDKIRYSDLLIDIKSKPSANKSAKPIDESTLKQQQKLDRTKYSELPHEISIYDKPTDLKAHEYIYDSTRYSELPIDSESRPTTSRYVKPIDDSISKPQEKLDGTRYSELFTDDESRPSTSRSAKHIQDSISKQEEKLDGTRYSELISTSRYEKPAPVKPQKTIHDGTRYSELFIDGESRPSGSRAAKSIDDSILEPHEQVDITTYSELLLAADSRLSASRYKNPIAVKPQKTIHDGTRYFEPFIDGESGPSASRAAKPIDESILDPHEKTDRTRYFELRSTSRYEEPTAVKPQKTIHDGTRYSELFIDDESRPSTSRYAKPIDDSILESQEKFDKTRYSELLLAADSRLSTSRYDKPTIHDETRYSEVHIDVKSKPRTSKSARPIDDSILEPQEKLDIDRFSKMLLAADSRLSTSRHVKPTAIKPQKIIHDESRYSEVLIDVKRKPPISRYAQSFDYPMVKPKLDRPRGASRLSTTRSDKLSTLTPQENIQDRTRHSELPESYAKPIDDSYIKPQDTTRYSEIHIESKSRPSTSRYSKSVEKQRQAISPQNNLKMSNEYIDDLVNISPKRKTQDHGTQISNEFLKNRLSRSGENAENLAQKYSDSHPRSQKASGPKLIRQQTQYRNNTNDFLPQPENEDSVERIPVKISRESEPIIQSEIRQSISSFEKPDDVSNVILDRIRSSALHVEAVREPPPTRDSKVLERQSYISILDKLDTKEPGEHYHHQSSVAEDDRKDSSVIGLGYLEDIWRRSRSSSEKYLSLTTDDIALKHRNDIDRAVDEIGAQEPTGQLEHDRDTSIELTEVDRDDLIELPQEPDVHDHATQSSNEDLNISYEGDEHVTNSDELLESKLRQLFDIKPEIQLPILHDLSKVIEPVKPESSPVRVSLNNLLPKLRESEKFQNLDATMPEALHDKLQSLPATKYSDRNLLIHHEIGSAINRFEVPKDDSNIKLPDQSYARKLSLTVDRPKDTGIESSPPTGIESQTYIFTPYHDRQPDIAIDTTKDYNYVGQPSLPRDDFVISSPPKDGYEKSDEKSDENIEEYQQDAKQPQNEDLPSKKSVEQQTSLAKTESSQSTDSLSRLVDETKNVDSNLEPLDQSYARRLSIMMDRPNEAGLIIQTESSPYDGIETQTYIFAPYDDRQQDSKQPQDEVLQSKQSVDIQTSPTKTESSTSGDSISSKVSDVNDDDSNVKPLDRSYTRKLSLTVDRPKDTGLIIETESSPIDGIESQTYIFTPYHDKQPGTKDQAYIEQPGLTEDDFIESSIPKDLPEKSDDYIKEYPDDAKQPQGDHFEFKKSFHQQTSTTESSQTGDFISSTVDDVSTGKESASPEVKEDKPLIYLFNRPSQSEDNKENEPYKGNLELADRPTLGEKSEIHEDKFAYQPLRVDEPRQTRDSRFKTATALILSTQAMVRRKAPVYKSSASSIVNVPIKSNKLETPNANVETKITQPLFPSKESNLQIIDSKATLLKPIYEAEDQEISVTTKIIRGHTQPPISTTVPSTSERTSIDMQNVKTEVSVASLISQLEIKTTTSSLILAEKKPRISTTAEKAPSDVFKIPEKRPPRKEPTDGTAVTTAAIVVRSSRKPVQPKKPLTTNATSTTPATATSSTPAPVSDSKTNLEPPKPEGFVTSITIQSKSSGKPK